MSRQTGKVLYAKYNSARRPDFRVTTEFCEDESGFYVRKRAGEPAAEAHLENILKNSESLQGYYRAIKVISTEKRDGVIRFPYIQGRTLAEQIDSPNIDKARFVARVNEKLAAVLSIQEQYYVPFRMTAEFGAIFGETALGEVPALNPANIDSLLSNFVENEDGVTCIDCEWVCHFPVPYAFVKYRILLYLYVTQAHALLKGISLEEMLGWFGFSEREREIYWQMDDHFQQYVHGENRKYIYSQHYRKDNWAIGDMERERQALRADVAAKAGMIHDKDVHIQSLEETIRDMNALVGTQKAIIHDKNARIHALVGTQKAIIHDKNARIHALEETIRDKDVHIGNQDAQIQRLTTDFQTISSAFFWRITKPARATVDVVRRAIHKNENVYQALRFTKKLVRFGPAYAKEDRQRLLAERERLLKKINMPSQKEAAMQRHAQFPRDIKFSVLVPLYNTPEQFLREMIKSVQEQTYSNWELCLADGSDGSHAAVGKLCLKLAKKDSRIHYRKLEKNLGISENTNACIAMATGDYIALLDHDDVLNPSALYENMNVICNEDADFIYSDEGIFHKAIADTYYFHFKSDFAPDTLRSYNYICHLTVFKKALLEENEGFRSKFDGSQDYDMILRLTERAKRIAHIPKVLYYWRSHDASVASDISAKPYTVMAGKAALADHLERVGLKGSVVDSRLPSTYRVQYAIDGDPLVSIVIPNMDHVDDLRKCIDSISEKSTWKNWEIIVVENNSKERETFEYYRSLENRPEIKVVTWEGGFNFSAICNYGAKAARGDHILLLNNDIEVITPDWLEQMLMFSQREDVGAVGAMLYYPDETIQHAGLIVGIGGSAGHSHKGLPRGDYGYLMRLTLAQDLSGVTGACCMVPRRVWEQVGGLDESFVVAFNDVDLSLRIRKAGYLIVWTPYAELYHYESKSRGYEDTPEKMERFNGERERLRERWGAVIDAGDPYYNPNLTLDREDFSFK